MALLVAVAAVAQTTPGFQFLGFGYNLLRGNPSATNSTGDPGMTRQLFAFTNTTGQKTTDGKWDIPDQTSSQMLSTCSVAQEQEIIDSAYTYIEKVSNGISSGSENADFGGLQFTGSHDYEDVDEETREVLSIFAQVTAECAAYGLTMHMYDHPNFSPEVVNAVKQLPAAYDETAYMTFIDRYGTHAIGAVTVGGRWGWQMSFEQITYQHMVTHKVDIGTGIKYAAEERAGIASHHGDENMRIVVESIKKNSSFSVGGSYSPDLQTWIDSVRDLPMPIKITITAMNDLMDASYFDDPQISNKSVAMQKAISEYCPWAQKDDPKLGCKAPKPVPPPTPAPVKKDSARRVCVWNGGGYLLSFKLYDTSQKYPVPSESGRYTAGQMQCVEGAKVGAVRGDKLLCVASAVAGKTVPCDPAPYEYDERSTQQAVFHCGGSTLSINCKFVGFSPFSTEVMI
mmetsp:Transcript_77951/g.208333  ORF Transcript_77951/g.208333 Transcript_77951/m.208333 type:complete len:455 (+) Transcript_77951:69-1433(+)